MEPDPNSLLSFPMSWQFVCANGHLTGGMDFGRGESETVVVKKP